MKKGEFIRLYSSKIFVAVLFLLTCVLEQESIPAQENYTFVYEKFANSRATKILSRLEKCCSPECVKHWHYRYGSPELCALELLGKPVAPLIIDSLEKNYRNCECAALSNLLHINYFKNDPNFGSSNFTKEEFERLRNSLKTEPNFPSDNELKSKSFNELAKIYQQAARCYSADSSRVIMWYLSYVDKLLQNDKIKTEDCLDAIDRTTSAYYSPSPEMLPLLIKFAIFPYNIKRPDWSSIVSTREQECMQRWAVEQLSVLFKRTLSGVIHLALIEGLESPENRYCNIMISIAMSPAADIDITIVQELLSKTGEYDKSDIAETLGKSGNRAYRKLLQPLLNDKDKKVRYAAAKGLAYLGDDSGMNLIEEQLKEMKIGDWEYDSLIKSLGRLGTDKACNILCEQLAIHVKTKGNLVPSQIIEAMKDSCNNSYLDKLFQIRTETGKLYEFVGSAIKVVADESSIPVLAKYLEDKDTDTVDLVSNLIIKLAKIELKGNENPVQSAKNWWREHRK